MRVVSSLADIDFGIGRVFRQGKNLVIESDKNSTLETTVTITPRDALASLGAMVTSPSVWWFIITLPISLFSRSTTQKNDDENWQERRKRIELNKPW